MPHGGADNTQKILDVLADYGVKATFFVVGNWADQYPEQAKAIVESGNELMNHSNAHDHYNSLTADQIIADVNTCSDKIEALTGVRPTLIRCPFGEYDDHVISAIRSIGMEPIQWDVDSLDWKGISAGEITKRVTGKVTNGSIVLFHNAGEFMAWPENPAAFAILLDEAGVDWTLSTDVVGYDSVNYGIWYDDVQAKNVAMAQFEAARKLGVKRIVIGECGHAHKAAVVGADRMADSQERGVPVESFLPMMAEFVRNGRLKFDPSKNDFPVTLHDPCNIVRQMGIVEPQREILRAIAPQFREMTPHGVDNYCCGGGSGFAIMNSYNFGDFRTKVSGRMKFAQILNAFADEMEDPDIVKYVCAPCSNCKGTIRDLLQAYKATARYNVQYGGIVELMVNGLASMDRPYFEFLEE